MQRKKISPVKIPREKKTKNFSGKLKLRIPGFIVACGLGVLMFACNGIGGIKESTQSIDESAWLLPTPKKAVLGRPITFRHSKYTLNDRIKLSPETLKWLKEELENKLGWKERISEKLEYSISISKTDIAENENKEFYTLEISAKEIKIGAHTEDGACRAIGRLLCIIDSPLLKILPDSSVQCPEIKIEDWPDYSLRGMQLRLRYNHYSRKPNMPFIKKELDVMARFGFNFAVFEIGGYYESSKRPEATQPPQWTQKELRELAAYANARGIMPVPGINSIGHLRTGPLICPLKGIGKSGKEEPIISDLGNPDYYNIYFDMMDELIEIFGNAPFFHIGTDEFHGQGLVMLEKLTGKSGHELYAEFLNKVNSHLAAKGIRPVVWHDMLVDENKYKDCPECEAANGSLTWQAFNEINKKIIINYWGYYPFQYNILEDIIGKGFEIWVSPWSNIKGNEKLCIDGFHLGAKAVLGTTWNVKPYLEAFPATGEFSWNTKGPHKKPLFVYETYNTIFFYGRNSKKPLEKISQITEINGTTTPSGEFTEKLNSAFPGMIANFSGIPPLKISTPKSFFIFGITPPPEITPPYNFKSLIQNHDAGNILICTPSSSEWLTPLTGFNKRRDKDDAILYTPSYGETTRTNKSGFEIAVLNSKVINLSEYFYGLKEQGNMQIPKDGFVISTHGSSRDQMRNFARSFLTEGGDLTLRLRSSQSISSETVSIPLNSRSTGFKNFIIFLTTEHPVDANGVLGNAELIMADKKKSSLPLYGSIFFEPMRYSQFSRIIDIPEGKWKIWIAWNAPNMKMNKIIALEWKSDNNSKTLPDILKISASREGIESGLTVLGAVQY